MPSFGNPDFNQEGKVSLWVGVRPARDLPKDYFEEQYEDDDQPISRFAADFGFHFYDHDFIELNVAETGPHPIRDLLAGHSWAASFVDAADTAAARAGLRRCEYLVLMYDFSYVPETTGISSTSWFRFIGSFPYRKDA